MCNRILDIKDQEKIQRQNMAQDAALNVKFLPLRVPSQVKALTVTGS